MDQGTSIAAAICSAEHVPQRIYKADGDAHSWEWLAMVSPCVDVLRNLANHINTDLGARQGKKHASPDTKKDIDILMASLSKLEVYVEKEGRTLDPDEMPVPDAVSVGLAELAHGSALRKRRCFGTPPDRLRTGIQTEQWFIEWSMAGAKSC